MADSERYLEPAGYGEALLVEKRSKFTARVWPAANEAEALEHIGEMRKTYWDATHNVFAYIIRGGPTRYGDDGEPQGTSGMPTLNVFVKEGVFNVCCVVTRYFGGVLLGAGGLVRAYSSAAKLALDAAGTRVVRRWDVVLLPCPYALLERVKGAVTARGGVIEKEDFGVEVMIEALLPVEETAECLRRVLDVSAGNVVGEVMDTVFRGA